MWGRSSALHSPQKTPEVEARMLAAMNEEEQEQYHQMQKVCGVRDGGLDRCSLTLLLFFLSGGEGLGGEGVCGAAPGISNRD